MSIGEEVSNVTSWYSKDAEFNALADVAEAEKTGLSSPTS
jgi:hypothetical protein